jgi:hypothetical protein
MMVMMLCNWHSYLPWTHNIIWKHQIFGVSHTVCLKSCQQSQKTLLLPSSG